MNVGMIKPQMRSGGVVGVEIAENIVGSQAQLQQLQTQLKGLVYIEVEVVFGSHN